MDKDRVIPERTISLPNDIALVLFEWLARTDDLGAPAPFVDQAEQAALWNCYDQLQRVLAEPFREDYKEIVQMARDRVRTFPEVVGPND